MSIIPRSIRVFRNRLRLRKNFSQTFGGESELKKLLIAFLGKQLFVEYADEVHLEAAMQWLLEAQQACQGQGVAAKLEVSSGWTGAYPETSGYILGSYLVYYDLTGKKEFYDKAIELGDWEIDIQTESGAVRSNMHDQNVRVFNTGQVMLGWCLLYERTRESRFLEAAKKAGDFLVNTQEKDGSWVQNTYCGARTYHARVDWALLRVTDLCGDKKYEAAAMRNLEWVKAQFKNNGWIANCGFNADDPITHVLDYTWRGLLECHILRPQLQLLPMVVASVDKMLESVEKDPVLGVEGMVPQSFSENWGGDVKTSCLTGNAQISYLLLRLNQVNPNSQYVTAANRILTATKRTQIFVENKTLRGAIPGCYPFYIGYCQNSFPNWAAKFFADALMIRKHSAVVDA